MNVRHDKITLFVVRPDAAGRSYEFLQLRRSDDEYLAGTWQTVRGGVEPGETYIAAAVRELREETGLVPREFYVVGSIESFYTAADDTMWHAVVFCSMVGRDDAVRLNQEHDDLRWVPRAEMESSIMWPSERPILADVMREILDGGRAKPLLRCDLNR